MNIGQPGELKYYWGIFTHLSVGRLYPNVDPGWSRDYGVLAKVCNGIKQHTKSTLHSRKLLVKLLYA